MEEMLYTVKRSGGDIKDQYVLCVRIEACREAEVHEDRQSEVPQGHAGSILGKV